MPKFVSRREFLQLLGATGGTAAALQAGATLGLLPNSVSAAAINFQALGASSGRVAILGGGLSGLTVAYELSRLGYECTVLEASHRCGGRIMTVRHGDLIDEIGNRQYCEFDDESHLYFNCGAARIPSTHQQLLAYCKELGVELEVFVGENRTSYVQDDNMLGGKPLRQIEYRADMRGFMAELMTKAMTSEEMNQPFTESEAEAMLGLIRRFGDLSEDDIYRGSFNAGYQSGGYLDHGVQKDIVAVTELLKSRTATSTMLGFEGDYGPMLMQPVGGMDRIIKGFTDQLPGQIRYRAQVASIHVRDDGVNISYDQDGARHTLDVDYCFNCVPTHLVVGLDHNFPDDYVRALKYVRRGEAYKAAFQAKERFWEKEGIYGGITWMNNSSQQLWYPFHGIHKDKGVVLAAYDYGARMHHTMMKQHERVESHIRDGEKVHPNYRQMVEKPVTIAWHRMNHMLGCAARWSRNFGRWTGEEEQMYHTLQAPVNGRHYMIGDQISMHSAWMESAIHSAHLAMQ
ncbi:MAG: FAD-dependent oxidoreductase, partial [Gammaproteobacteria bacterium]